MEIEPDISKLLSLKRDLHLEAFFRLSQLRGGYCRLLVGRFQKYWQTSHKALTSSSPVEKHLPFRAMGPRKGNLAPASASNHDLELSLVVWVTQTCCWGFLWFQLLSIRHYSYTTRSLHPSVYARPGKTLAALNLPYRILSLGSHH